jgi:hypothetical protein
VTRAVEGTIADEFKAFTGDFKAVISSSLAIVKIVANIKVRLRDNAIIAQGTGFF